MQLHRFAFRAMGSPCELQFYADTPVKAQAAFDAAWVEIERLEQKYSRYREGSVTTRINRSAGGVEGVAVDAETAALLDYAAQAYVQSDGLFDITSGVLRRVWDFKSGCLPEASKIKSELARIGWARVQWMRPVIVLPLAGMELDFGGYVKEYTADAAATKLIALGVQHGLVELGGDIRVLGPRPDGSAWRVGIRHPEAPRAAMAAVELREGAIASSGDYERYMDVNGQRYCHILNPKTGWPARGLQAVSVIAPQCLIAGTATTIAMLKGSDGLAWLQQLGLPWLAVDARGELHRPA